MRDEKVSAAATVNVGDGNHSVWLHLSQGYLGQTVTLRPKVHKSTPGARNSEEQRFCTELRGVLWASWVPGEAPGGPGGRI